MVCKKVNDTVSVWMNVYIQVVMNIIEFTADMGASGGFRRTKSSRDWRTTIMMRMSILGKLILERNSSERPFLFYCTRDHSPLFYYTTWSTPKSTAMHQQTSATQCSRVGLPSDSKNSFPRTSLGIHLSRRCCYKLRDWEQTHFVVT